MKIKYKLLVLLISIFALGCEKEQYLADFSTSKPIYVEFTTASAVTVMQGETASVALRLREAMQEPVVVTYEVTGAVTITSTATIPRNTLAGTIAVPIPNNIIPVGSNTATATIKIKSAKAGSQDLTIGYGGTNFVSRTITISR